MKPKLFSSMMSLASAALGLSTATEKPATSKAHSKVVFTPEYRPKAASRRAYRQLKRYRRIGEFNQEYTQRRRLERVKDTNRKLFAFR